MKEHSAQCSRIWITIPSINLFFKEIKHQIYILLWGCQVQNTIFIRVFSLTSTTSKRVVPWAIALMIPLS